MHKLKGIQIYYDYSQEGKLNPTLIPYFNQPMYAPCLENHVISEQILLGNHKDCDYFGVFSWKFEKKHARSLTKLMNEVANDKDNIDVYSFFSIHTKPNLWVVAEKWHAGILEAAKHIFRKTNLGHVADDLEKIRMSSIYQNAFFARPDIYEDYVKTWLVPLMEAMLDPKDTGLQKMLNVDTRYKSELNKGHLKTTFGVPYYTLHPFICERFFSTYLSYTNFKIKHIA